MPASCSSKFSFRLRMRIKGKSPTKLERRGSLLCSHRRGFMWIWKASSGELWRIWDGSSWWLQPLAIITPVSSCGIYSIYYCGQNNPFLSHTNYFPPSGTICLQTTTAIVGKQRHFQQTGKRNKNMENLREESSNKSSQIGSDFLVLHSERPQFSPSVRRLRWSQRLQRIITTICSKLHSFQTVNHKPQPNEFQIRFHAHSKIHTTPCIASCQPCYDRVKKKFWSFQTHAGQSKEGSGDGGNYHLFYFIYSLGIKRICIFITQ